MKHYIAFVLCALSWSASADERTRGVNLQTWDTENGLPQNTVQAILQTRDGYLWFGTEGGLARFNSQSFTVFNTANTPQFRSNDIRALLEDADGTLWIATADGVATLRNGQFQAFTTSNGLPSNAVTGLFPDRRRTCAVTAVGSACFGNGRFVAIAGATSLRPPVLDPKLQQFVTSNMLCSYKDHEGDIWIGTESSGVTILRTLHFESFSDRDLGLDSQVRCVYRDRAGAIWFGTDSQGLTRLLNGHFSRFTVAKGLSSNVIVSLGEDSSGDLLIGTPDGLNRLLNDAITLATSSEGLPDDFIRSIHTDRDGTVWLGTRRGLARLRNNQFQTFTHANGLGSDLIGSIIRDASGVLWIATLHGLSRFDGSRFENFTTAAGLSSNIITALYTDREGTLWIGTQGGGLNRYSAGVFHHMVATGIPETIYGITADQHQNLWLASDTGVFRVRFPEVVSYGVSDGCA